MSKYDRNGVKHDGWASVGRANRNHRGHSGVASASYESMAKSQGVDLSRTGYRDTSGCNVEPPYNPQFDWYGYRY